MLEAGFIRLAHVAATAYAHHGQSWGRDGEAGSGATNLMTAITTHAPTASPACFLRRAAASRLRFASSDSGDDQFWAMAASPNGRVTHVELLPDLRRRRFYGVQRH